MMTEEEIKRLKGHALMVIKTAQGNPSSPYRFDVIQQLAQGVLDLSAELTAAQIIMDEMAAAMRKIKKEAQDERDKSTHHLRGNQ
jgi:hypothetical protein